MCCIGHGSFQQSHTRVDLVAGYHREDHYVVLCWGIQHQEVTDPLHLFQEEGILQ